MEAWKSRVGNVIQKINITGKNILSSLQTEKEQTVITKSEANYEHLYFRDQFYASDDYVDRCIDCNGRFGILTIHDDEEEEPFGFEDDVFDRRNDREEIRRKLAMDSDTEEFLPEKVNQNSENKPSMRARDNSNLQICFVNEAVTDEDSPKSCDTKVNDCVKACDLLPVPQNVPSQAASSNTPAVKNSSRTPNNNSAQSSVVKRQRPTFFFNRPRSMILQKTDQKAGVEDLVSRHIRLQAEAREALAQAKEMARMQMEIEKQQKKKSPIAEIVGLPFPDGKTYLNHSTLKDMNVAQLQVIVNDLHSQIESLNEDLVKFLLERDDLHMEQDSMLVDIEDLTRYLGLKGSNCVSHPTHSQTSIKTYNASSDKVLKSEPVVKRSHSVQLRKTKNLM